MVRRRERGKKRRREDVLLGASLRCTGDKGMQAALYSLLPLFLDAVAPLNRQPAFDQSRGKRTKGRSSFETRSLQADPCSRRPSNRDTPLAAKIGLRTCEPWPTGFDDVEEGARTDLDLLKLALSLSLSARALRRNDTIRDVRCKGQSSDMCGC